MKPYEYYNYPKKNKRLWWLPLPLVLVLVIISYIDRSCGADAPEETWSTGPSQVQLGPVEQDWHTVLVGGRLYNVLDREYQGDYELRRVYFVYEPWTDNMDGEILIPVDRAAAVPEDFPRQAVLDRAEYETFCQAWGLTPAFPAHAGRFALVARGTEGSALQEIRVGGLSVSGSTATLMLLERFAPASADADGFVLVLPVPESVTELKVEPLYTQAEIDGFKQ